MSLALLTPSRSVPSLPTITIPARVRSAADRLATHDVTVLRMSLGAIVVLFGTLKFFPGASPAEPLVTHAVRLLTFGMITGQAAMIATAVVEVAMGLMLLTGTFRRLGILLYGACLAGWMSPLVLFPADLFTAHGPTLAAQYILKDIPFAAAGLVMASREFRSQR